MRKRSVLIAATLALLSGFPAHAQYGGGGGGHQRGGGGPPRQGGDSAPPQREAIPADEPLDQVEIVGIVQAIDPATDRITIAYEPVQALNWPAGVLPFVVSHSALLQGVSVGEKVRFKLDSQQISALRPF